MLTALQHVAAVRKDPAVIARLVDDMRAEPRLVEEAQGLLAHYAELDRAGRLESCWISRTAKETLTAALAAAQTSPDVPAGG
jgi:hypothetical protein